MPANDAFTAGVRPGGLTSSTEIRLLLCYLVKNAGPIARQEIENALMEEALVNYFEIGSCLDDITRQQLVTVQDNVYSITDKGRKVAQELAYDLPRSVRERAVAAVLRCQTWARKEAKYSASITEKPDEDGYSIFSDYLAALNHGDRNRREGELNRLKNDAYLGLNLPHFR